MVFLAWIFVLVLLLLFFHFYGEEPGSFSYSEEHGTLTIAADSKGHYWLDGHINDKPVRFMLDTGATYVALPQALARDLGIRGRYPLQLNTAAGRVEGQLSRVQELRFAGFSFTDVKVVIMPPEVQSTTVLLGMNILSHFSITQKDRTLIIQR
ncbi:MAG: retroviral-like aspartic protease family protein [Legionellaceae bacterium]|nr:retroviral-like aspartic protease family protein [Legionellaceae bacterium]